MNRTTWLLVFLVYGLTANAQVIYKFPKDPPPEPDGISSQLWQETYQRSFPDGYIIQSYRLKTIDTNTINTNPAPAPDTAFALYEWKHFNRISDSVYRCDAFAAGKKSGVTTWNRLMRTGEVVICAKNGKQPYAFLPEFKREKTSRAGGDSIVEICTGTIREKDTLYTGRKFNIYTGKRLSRTVHEHYDNARSLHKDSVSLLVTEELSYPEPWVVRVKLTVTNSSDSNPAPPAETDYIYNEQNELIRIRLSPNMYSPLPKTEWRFVYEKGICTQYQVWEGSRRCVAYTIVKAQTASEAKKLLQKNSR